jgi:type I restriction enzyme, S subunit
VRSFQSFFNNFAHLANVPNGVAQLRELILQLAIQGKLVAQDSRDEPSAELLKRIANGNEQFKKRKRTESSFNRVIEAAALPFEIPARWRWTSLSNVGHEWGQKRPDVDFTYIDVAAIDNERGAITDDVKTLRSNEAPSRARKLVKPGTLIYSTVRPYLLNIAIVEKEYSPEPIASTAFAIIHPFDGISAKYLFHYLRSRTFIDFVESQMQGVAYPAINDEKLFSAPVPLPPTHEQERIVVKVDELLQLCDELEARQQARRESRVRLNNATLAPLNSAASLASEELTQAASRLADNFATLYDSSETIGKLRSTIIQLAVQGKLVPQVPHDKPAALLLAEISKEKEFQIQEKKSKQVESLPQIKENDCLTDSIPRGWSWAWLGNLARFVDYRGKTPPKTETGVKLITAKNVRMGFISEHPREFISEETYQRVMTRGFPKVGDILFTTEAPLGNVAQLMTDERIALAQRVIDLQPFRPFFAEYLKVCLMSPLMQQALIERATGMTASGIKASKLKVLPVPVPPLEEQKRIVAKVNQLMALCDELETKLRQVETDSEKLMNAAMHQVLSSIT